MVRVFKCESGLCLAVDGTSGRLMFERVEGEELGEGRRRQLSPEECPYRKNQGCQKLEVVEEETKKAVN